MNYLCISIRFVFTICGIVNVGKTACKDFSLLCKLFVVEIKFKFNIVFARKKEIDHMVEVEPTSAAHLASSFIFYNRRMFKYEPFH